MEHVDIPLGERHQPHNFSYANAAARSAAVVTDADLIDSLALQQDDGSYWRLESVAPAVWTESGLRGPQGIQGEPGADGADGVDGADGADGTSVALKGSVPTVGDLPGGATQGDLYIVLADGHGYVWSGASWDDVGPIQGPEGPEGPEGPPGTTTWAGITDKPTTLAEFGIATAKTTPVDADELMLGDSAASALLKKLTWANLKATLKTYFDSLYPSGSGTSTGTNTGDQTSVTGNAGTATALATPRAIDGQNFDGTAAITVIAPGTHAATGKTTPVDADELPLVDSAASNVLKKLTWANLKATLKTYFDTLYQNTLGYTAEDVANKSTNLAADAASNTKYPSAKAVADAIALAVTGLLEFIDATDCSGNPNYPAANKGDSYVVSVAGKIGGASGSSVDAGDMYFAKADNAGGTQASVGTSWVILEHNLAGALLAANNLSDLTNAGTARTNLGLGTLATQSGTFSGISSGTNTGDQTSVTGNAGTATALATPRAIDGQNFDGTAAITVIAPGTHAATGKTTPVDADELPLVDSAASNVLKKLTWANLKATLKTYFDTLYAVIGAVTGSGLTMATGKMLGRATAGTGAVEEIATTGTGSAVLATTPTLVTPVLGVATATSINKMAVTAPATGSTLAVADGKTLTASNTLTLVGTDGTTQTFQGTDTIVGRTTTDTLTNKRVTARVGSTTSSATPTINTDNVDVYKLTAQTADITSFTTNLSGTPVDNDILIIEITGTAARAITWGSSFEASTVALPTTTVTTAMLAVGFLWNAATSKWRCVAAV